MNRRFFRHFFDLHDPFFFPSAFHRPMKVHIRNLRPLEREFNLPKYQNRDPYQIFDSFFNENGIKEGQKDFFKKHYPQKVKQKSDPFKVLEIDKNSNEEQIKQAYRKLALKYHPKNNSSPQAQQKFAELAKAYQEALQQKNQAKYPDFGFKSFFQDFDKQVQQMFGLSKQQGQKKIQNGKKDQQFNKKDNSYGQLYSQSTHAQNINGKQTKFIGEKKYKKDDKTLSVKRQQTLKQDGKTEIVETIDDGKEVKKKQYILDKDTKQAKKIQQK